jgi:uncharacterized membrane protein (DUF2068 family)
MTEQQFTNELLKWAKAYRWRAFHVRNSGFGGNTQVQGDKGFPDLVLIRGARLLVAELKVAKAGTKAGDAKPEQLVWLEMFKQVGAETYTWHPQQWSEILAILSKP